MTRPGRAAAALLGVLLLAGCAGDEATTEPTEADTGVLLATAAAEVVAPGECEQVFAEAAETGEAAPEDLDAAFTVCEDLAAFTDAAELHPEALSEPDVDAYVSMRGEEAVLVDSPVCTSAGA